MKELIVTFLLWFPAAVFLEGIVEAHPGSFSNKAKKVLYYLLTAPSAWIKLVRNLITRKVQFTRFHGIAFWFKN